MSYDMAQDCYLFHCSRSYIRKSVLMGKVVHQMLGDQSAKVIRIKTNNAFVKREFEQ